MAQFRGTIADFDPATYRATVRLDGSAPRTLADIHANRLLAGAYAAGRRCIVDTGDHNDLEDAVVVAVWTEAGPDFPDLFYAYDGTGAQSLTGTAVTVNLDQNPAPGERYALSSDVVTFGADGRYRVTAELVVTNTDTAGTADAAIRLTAEEDTGSGFAAVPEGIAAQVHREVSVHSSVALSFARDFAAGDQLRLRADRPTGGTNIETVTARLLIEYVQP